MTNLTLQDLYQKISEANKSIDLLEKIKAFKHNPISNIEEIIYKIKLHILDVVDEIDRRSKIAAAENVVVTVIFTDKE